MTLQFYLYNNQKSIGGSKTYSFLIKQLNKLIIKSFESRGFYYNEILKHHQNEYKPFKMFVCLRIKGNIR